MAADARVAHTNGTGQEYTDKLRADALAKAEAKVKKQPKKVKRVLGEGPASAPASSAAKPPPSGSNS